MAETDLREGVQLEELDEDVVRKPSRGDRLWLVRLAAVVFVIGGWERMQSSMIAVFSLIWAGLYVFFAIMIARWNRGLLPVAASLAVIMTIFAGVAAPGWFARSKDGLDSPALPEDLIGLLVVILIPVQILLVIVALIAFGQEWHVEEERPIGGRPLHGEGDTPDAAPAPA